MAQGRVTETGSMSKTLHHRRQQRGEECTWPGGAEGGSRMTAGQNMGGSTYYSKELNSANNLTSLRSGPAITPKKRQGQDQDPTASPGKVTVSHFWIQTVYYLHKQHVED